MLILAIETSCDETSIALVGGDNKTKQVRILSNVVSSQVKLHAKWGGVVPNLAAREHLKNIIPVLEKALSKSKKKITDVDLFAVTQGPGLIPALLIGTNVAKTLSYQTKKPLLGIHHIEGHIFAAFGDSNSKFKIDSSKFPILCLVVSGGHTQLILMKDLFQYEIIGQTQDDAAGEAFDKIAKILGLGYPGGPIVAQRAQNFHKESHLNLDPELESSLAKMAFPRPMISSGNLDFSFSGLKTSILYFYRGLIEKHLSLSASENDHARNNICFEFQKAVVEVLVSKTKKAVDSYAPKTVLLAGGVAANETLQFEMKNKFGSSKENINFLAPNISLCGDNAAMIGTAAFFRYQKMKELEKLSGLKDSWKHLEADANMKLRSI